MKRSVAIDKLDKFLKNGREPNATAILLFLEKELDIKPLRYISSGCMCGHFDRCNCGPGRYVTDWDKE